MKLYVNVEMDRPFTEEHYVTPGGFNFTFNGTPIQFDFTESTTLWISPYPRNCVHFELNQLDIQSFPESLVMTQEQTLRNIDAVNEVFIYTGEKGEDPEIHLNRILDITFELDGKKIAVPHHLVEEYNKSLQQKQKVVTIGWG